MKLDTFLCSCNNSELRLKPRRRCTGKLPEGCYQRRRKISVTTNRGVVAVPRGWFGVVKKKLHVKTKSTPHNKNIIIIHNNTSITGNEEDNRASVCVEPGKDQAGAKNKDAGQDGQDVKKKKPGDAVVDEKPAIIVAKSADVEDQKDTPVDEAKKKIEGGDQEELKRADGGDNGDEGKVDVKEKPVANVEVEALVEVKDSGDREEEEQVRLSDEKAVAAITIQTAFRSHLARRAFKALRSLVRLQAVVRGVVARRQARLAMHCMSALVRLGDRVRARQLLSRSSHE